MRRNKQILIRDIYCKTCASLEICLKKETEKKIPFSVDGPGFYSFYFKTLRFMI